MSFIKNQIFPTVSTQCNILWNQLERRAEESWGRVMQISVVTFVALVATTAIFVQVKTDSEHSATRADNEIAMQALNAMTFDMFDISLLLASEMEPFYLYNRGPYDNFLQKAQVPMRKTDTKLLWISSWPSDVSALAPDEQANLSSVVAIRNALRGMRDMRKAMNGTSEDDVINFYSRLIDAIGILVRLTVLGAKRFPGWKEFISILYSFQMLTNFKKYSLTGQKLAAENRTVTIEMPLYQSLLAFYTRYVEYEKIFEITSDAANILAKNLSEQESVKNVERWFSFVIVQDFESISGDAWNTEMTAHEADLLFIIDKLRKNVVVTTAYYSTAWPETHVFSAIVFAIAAVFAVLAMASHLYATILLQSRVLESNKVLAEIREALTLVYDYIPSSGMELAKTVSSLAPRKHQDICLLMMDMGNAQELVDGLEPKILSEVLDCFYQEIERCLNKFTCFKLEVLGDGMSLASGLGEFHGTDHIGEMQYLGLEILDNFAPKETSQNNEINIRLRIGIHVGLGYSRIFTTRKIPQAGVFGPVTFDTALIHATGINGKIHVSANVASRLMDVGEIDFLERGWIKVNNDQQKAIQSFWAVWTDIGDDLKSQKSSLSGMSIH